MNFLTDTIEFPNLFSGDISINRVAFSVFNIDIYWYGILIALGVVLGFAYALKRAKKVGLIADNVFDVAFIGTIFGFIGARAYFCIFYNLNPENVRKYTFWTAITEVHDGGLGIYGGIIAAVIAAFVACRIKKMPMTPLLDLAGPGFLIGQAIGRWGNFVNQECFGAPTAGNLPWGMTGSIISQQPEVLAAQEGLSSGEYALVHPCFLYESLWCIVGFLLIHFIGNKIRTFDGELFLYYAMWYGAGRGVIEGLRTDSLYAGSLRVSQVVGFTTAVLALIMIVFFKIRSMKNPEIKMYVNQEVSVERLKAYNDKLNLEKEKAKAKKAMKEAANEEKEKAPSILGDDEPENEEVKTEDKTEAEAEATTNEKAEAEEEAPSDDAKEDKE